jgi:hypothetical protein
MAGKEARTQSEIETIVGDDGKNTVRDNIALY